MFTPYALLKLFPKKSYGFETKTSDFSDDLDVNLGGFPEEEDWILYGPYSDKSLIRNKLTFDLSNAIGFKASNTKFYNLFINGDSKGLYILMEKIKKGKYRVPISDLRPSENAGDNLTGGYLMKIDKTSGSPSKNWSSAYGSGLSSKKSVIQVEYPKYDSLSYGQYSYIKKSIWFRIRPQHARIESRAGSSEENYIRDQKIQMMQDVVKKLKPRYRTLVELRYFKELSYEEIAEQLDLPLGTVKAQLFRAREFLFQIMKNTEGSI